MFDKALLGIGRQFNRWFAVYDQEKVLELLADDLRIMEGEDPATLALEHFEFNIAGGWVGDATPAFLVEPWRS